MEGNKRPDDVGILAVEMYFPKRFIPQTELEEKDNCKGKYTVGLGQLNMAFVDDREDITSIFLTAVTSLLRKYNIDPMSIGRLEVGTETLIDKSKSVKTSLMSLFGENSDLEGITNVNACYGGTAALFNSVSWVESSEWDGRYALVVCGDIAVYEEGPARPTGGCGAMAILVGPNAPLVLEPGVRASHMMDVYDFYKPAHSEYPVVDGRLSQWAFLTSVDKCYMRYKQKFAARYNTKKPLDVNHFDFFAMHTPYNKLIQKGFARLLLVDYKQFFDQQQLAPNNDSQPTSRSVSTDETSVEDGRTSPRNPLMTNLGATLSEHGVAINRDGKIIIEGSSIDPEFYAKALPLLETPLDETYESREIEALFKSVSKKHFDEHVTQCCKINQHVGNCYSGSVFSSLLSIVCDQGMALEGKRICMFSYGSGSAASMYSFLGRVPDASKNSTFTLESIQRNSDVFNRLHKNRTQCKLSEFNAALDMRERHYGKAPMTPEGEVSPRTIFPRTFYLVSVNEKHHRVYAQTPAEEEWKEEV
jgi:hydroxymethylglutaryl-CoA synthase